MTSLYDGVRDLPLVVERYEPEPLSVDVSTGFTRRTTVVHLHGGGEEGVGEDVTYEGEHHDGFAEAPELVARLERGGEPER